MDIIKHIRNDNYDILSRLEVLKTNSPEIDCITEMKLWGEDALASEKAKRKLIYSHLEDDSLSSNLRHDMTRALEHSKEFREAVRELLALTPEDKEWTKWFRTTLNLLRNKNQTEEQVLKELPEIFSNHELGHMVTEFERTREYDIDIGSFQARAAAN